MTEFSAKLVHQNSVPLAALRKFMEATDGFADDAEVTINDYAIIIDQDYESGLDAKVDENAVRDFEQQLEHNRKQIRHH